MEYGDDEPEEPAYGDMYQDEIPFGYELYYPRAGKRDECEEPTPYADQEIYETYEEPEQTYEEPEYEMNYGYGEQEEPEYDMGYGWE